MYHLDKKTGEMVPGVPEPEFEPFGEAPYIQLDSMPAYRHPATGIVTDSRSALRQMDAATGTITTDRKQAPNKSRSLELRKQLDKDRHEALHKAVAQVDAGTAPLSEETRHLCEIQNKIVSDALGFDAFNVAGRKKNEKGKRYRRR